MHPFLPFCCVGDAGDQTQVLSDQLLSEMATLAYVFEERTAL